MLTFLERLQAGQVLVADGATGSNLQQRGLDRGMPSERWVLENPEQIVGLHRDFIAAGADIILLDNMTPAQLRDAVTIVAGRAQTEASGGVTLETVRAIAETGVDFISVGALTHSARAVDVGLDFEL